MAYATYEDIENIYRELDTDERARADALLDMAATIIDAIAVENISDDIKKLVSVRMVERALSAGADQIPVGASQTSQSGLGYSQTISFGSYSSGELYLTKTEKLLLGRSNRVGSYSPVEELVEDTDDA